jgi:hypothetical protein
MLFMITLVAALPGGEVPRVQEGQFSSTTATHETRTQLSDTPESTAGIMAGRGSRVPEYLSHSLWVGVRRTKSTVPLLPLLLLLLLEKEALQRFERERHARSAAATGLKHRWCTVRGAVGRIEHYMPIDMPSCALLRRYYQ